MDHNFKKIARPDHIIKEQSQYLLFFFMMKVSPYFTYAISRYSNIKPNTISFISIFFLIISFPLIYYENYFYAFLFVFFNLFLDNIDGELARVTDQTSKLGEFLEKINSDIYYLCLYNFICLSFYNQNKIDLYLVIIFFALSIINFFVRGKISHITIPKNYSINSFNAIFFGLFKYSSNIRNNKYISKCTYLFFWNILASGGVSEIIIAILILIKEYELTINYIIFYNIICLIYIIILLAIKTYMKIKYKY